MEEDISSFMYDDLDTEIDMGLSESKGAKKRDKNTVGDNKKPTRGVATSFGFRRRPASSSRVEDNSRRRQKQDKNGNGGSNEDLRYEDVLSGRSTPLSRPRKDANGEARSNRFGCRQPAISKTAKVGDVGLTAEKAFGMTYKDAETAINNNVKKSTNLVYANQASQYPQKTVTKQTVILTYQPQQYSVQDRRPPSGSSHRSSSLSRANEPQRPPGKYTFQSNQLPRPQYPTVKTVDTKAAKQVANSARKAATTVDGWREGARSSVSTDSGVYTSGEGPELSPRSRRRPRNLEMVMKGAHNFHLRELQVTDLDIMDEAVITGQSVIPLPKLLTFESSPDYQANPVPTYRPPSPIQMVKAQERSPMSTLERYRRRNVRVDSEEEKFVRDRVQTESLIKQNSFIKSSSTSPNVNSSKDSSPSTKSEQSNLTFSVTETWQAHAAGEALANRSQDDTSVSLSISSEDDRIKESKGIRIDDLPVLRKTIVIEDSPVPHPLLMKSSTLTQHDSLFGNMMTSITSSNISTSTCTNNCDLLTLTLEDTKFDISALEASTHSLLDDETSPVDSLISTSSESTDLKEDKDISASSAYQTANTKTSSGNVVDDELDGEILDCAVVDKSSGSKNSPQSPGTPTHASGSLSLSDGKDFFDDEIADQPGLLFRKNNESSPMKSLNRDGNMRSRDQIATLTASPLVHRHRKLVGGKSGTERTPSLDTLSSLASDDLMMDNDLARSITSLQSVDDYIERLDSSLRGLNKLDELQLRQELTSSNAVRQWSKLLAQNNVLDQQLAAVSNKSLTASNASLASIGATLPVRTARLLQRSRAQTPSEVGGSEGSPSPAPASATILQDVVDIKTLLLQLKRVLQEPEEADQSMSSETLDPLLGACLESPRNGRRPSVSSLHPDASAEMRRQILFLQSQLEERDRLVKALQQRMLRMGEGQEHRVDDTCNVATQTDRLRQPTNTSLASSENAGLVSWNEQNGRKLPTYSEAQKAKRSLTNGSITKCQCGIRKNNTLNGLEAEKPNGIQLRTTSRIGSRYLQAIGNEDKRHYVKRDSSVDAKTIRKPLIYSNRSKSIENFHNQLSNQTIKENIVQKIDDTVKHHTSYGDLYNGRISSRESVNGNRLSPSLNGQSTDTDYSSDGGYKSLPSSINFKGTSPKRVSGIPRRSLEQKFVAAKHVRASAI